MSEYKLVPVEPTWEMTNAASENSDVNSFIDINNVYKAMLSASPATDTVTIDRAEYEAMKERLRFQDEWLSNGVYFTNDEYKAECEKYEVMKADAERYMHMRNNDMTAEYSEYITDVINDIGQPSLDEIVDQVRFNNEG